MSHLAASLQADASCLQCRYSGLVLSMICKIQKSKKKENKLIDWERTKGGKKTPPKNGRGQNASSKLSPGSRASPPPSFDNSVQGYHGGG